MANDQVHEINVPQGHGIHDQKYHKGNLSPISPYVPKYKEKMSFNPNDFKPITLHIDKNAGGMLSAPDPDLSQAPFTSNPF